MRGFWGSLAVLVVVVAGLTGCTATDTPAKPGVMVAKVNGSDKTVTVAAAKLDDSSAGDLNSIAEAGSVALGVPVRLSVDGGLPSDGATISRTYAAPLPEGAAAAFIWWNPDAGAWEAVPSELSEDRRVLTAHVSHFSIWDDIVAGTGSAIKAVTSAAKSAGQTVSDAAKLVGQGVSQTNKVISDAVQKGADWMFYAAGEVLSTRAEAPQCTGEKPDWVENADFIQDNPSNPLRFCIGSDASGNVVVKATANRGYAFPYTLAATPIAEDGQALGLKNALDTAVDLDKDIANSVARLTNSGRLILPGQTVGSTFSQEAVGALKDPAVLTASEPGVVRWAASTATAMLVKYGLGLDESYVGTTLRFATCGRDVMDAKDAGAIAKAIVSCVDTPAADRLIATGLEHTSAGTAAASIAKKLIAKLGVYLIIVSGLFEAGSYAGDSALPDSARTVDITSKPADQLAVALTAKGVGRFAFGSPEKDVLAYLTARLGQPAKTSNGPGQCEGAAGAYQSYVTFGPVTIRFGAQDLSATSPRTLQSWDGRFTSASQGKVKLDPSIPFGLSLDQLKARYPNGGGLEYMGAWATDDGVFLAPPDSPGGVEDIHAGPLDWCT